MSEVKVNKVSPRSGTTVTIGDSGDTINIVGTLQNNGSPLAGDISSVVAGTGLSGGATSGVATLNIEAAQPTITSLGTITGFTSTGIDDNATSTAITIDSLENVGIGTTSPVNDANYTGLTLSGATGSQVVFQDDGTTEGLIWNNNSLNIESRNTNSIAFRTASTERMRIDSSGNVGIGTSAPNAKLDVRGSAIFNEDGADVDFRVESDIDTNAIYMDGTDGRVKIGSGAGTGGTGKFNVSANGFSTSHSNAHIVMTNGNNTAGDKALIMGEVTSGGGVRYRPVAFGIENTQATLREGAFVIYVSDNQYVDLSTDERFRITNDGFVGIGTSSPTENLHVYDGASSGTASVNIANFQQGSNDSGGGSYSLATAIKIGGTTRYAQIKALHNQYASAATALSFWTDSGSNTEKMRLDSSGRLGIGETSMDALLVIKGDSDESTTPSIRLKDGSDSREAWITNTAGDLILTTGDNDNVPHTQLRMLNGNLMTFKTSNTEAMRIASDQSLFINTTGISTYTTRISLFQDNTKNCAIHLRTNATASQSQIIFGNGNGDGVGSIATSGTSTAYNTSSDYRLKENVSYDFDATARLKQLKPARFNFIADANTIVDGFLAHEVSDIVPEAISGEKDATKTKEKVVVNANGNVIAENIEQTDWETGKIADENGNTQYPIDSTWEATKVVPVYQGIDQSKLVPLLVKTIQELEARITTLENA